MIDILKIYNSKYDKFLLKNKLLKPESISFNVELLGPINVKKIIDFIYDSYKESKIETNISVSDFIFSEKEQTFLNIQKFYYLNILVVNISISDTKNFGKTISIKSEELYD